MNCTDAKEYMNRYIDGELGEEEARRLMSHIKECESCAKEFENISALKAALSNLDELKPPRDLVKPAIQKARRHPRVYAYMSACVAAALALLVIFTSGILPGGMKNESPQSELLMQDTAAEEFEAAGMAPQLAAAATSAPEADNQLKLTGTEDGFTAASRAAQLITVNVPADIADSLRESLFEYISKYSISEPGNEDSSIIITVPEGGTEELTALIEQAGLGVEETITAGAILEFDFEIP